MNEIEMQIEIALAASMIKMTHCYQDQFIRKKNIGIAFKSD